MGPGGHRAPSPPLWAGLPQYFSTVATPVRSIQCRTDTDTAAGHPSSGSEESRHFPPRRPAHGLPRPLSAESGDLEEGVLVGHRRLSPSTRWLAIGATTALLVAGCGANAHAAPPTVVPQSATPSSAAFDLSKVEDSVAYIQTQGTFVTADGTKEQVYSGSGFVIDSAGLVVTNNHVVTGGAFWKVQIGTDKTLYDAQLLGVSECSDLAVLKVPGTFPALRMSSATPTVGEPIYVAGHPNGDPYTLTNGIVAKPPYQADTSWASVKQEIQVTAQTYPGNSGGPVVDANGQVIGIEYAGGPPGSAIAGESFAIASSEALPVIQQLETGKNLEYLGINGEANSDSTGIAIVSVAPGSPADKAGILPGDLMTNLDGTAVGTDGTKSTYCSVLRSHTATDALSVTVERDGQTWTGEINGPALALVGSAGGSTTAPQASSGAPVGSATAGGTTTSIDKLQPYIPSNIWPNCTHSTDQVPSTVIQTAVCQPVSGVAAVWYDLYDSPADLNATISADAQSVKASTSRKCPAGPSEGTWSNTFPDGKVLQGPDLRLLCYTGSDGAWIEQADPTTGILFTAQLKGSLADLFKWWQGNATIVDAEPTN